jgi:hypothetical protein
MNEQAIPPAGQVIQPAKPSHTVDWLILLCFVLGFYGAVMTGAAIKKSQEAKQQRNYSKFLEHDINTRMRRVPAIGEVSP